MTCAPFATPRPRSALARRFRRSTNARHVRRRSPSIRASASGARWAWAARTSMGWAAERTLARQAGARGVERFARDLLGGARPRRGVRRLVAQGAAVGLEVEERERLARGPERLAGGRRRRGQAGGRGVERFARDLLGGARPRRGVRRLVAQEAAVALEVEEREELAEGHDALARGQPIHELPGLEAAPRHVAELHVGDLAEADVLDVAESRAAPPEVVGVEQEPAARVGRLRHHLAHARHRVELLGLRVELDRQPHPALRRDVADLAHALRRAPEVAPALVHWAHHGGAAEQGRALALLVEHAEEPAALVALGPHPAELDADARDGEPGALPRGH